MNYQEADKLLTGRNYKSRKLANHTYLVRDTNENNIAVKYHQTNVVILWTNGTTTLDSGGWRTKTTKERLNDYGNAGISQKAGIWYMKDGSLFYDGMVLRDGIPTKPETGTRTERQEKQAKYKAKLYAKGYTEALQQGLVPYPSAGDCWYCLFSRNNPNGNFGIEHIENHIVEQYYVPSLLVNAAHAAGYSNMQIALMGLGGQDIILNPEKLIYKYVYNKLIGRKVWDHTARKDVAYA